MDFQLSDLSYDERRFLQAFHYFLGVEYRPDNVSDMELGQNMVAFLQRIGWMHTDFEFMLYNGPKGMYSAGMELFLRRLNRKAEAVKQYQSSDRFLGELSLNDWRTLGEFSGTYLIDWYEDDLVVWMKCLAMVFYIKEVTFGEIERPLQDVCDRLWQEDDAMPESYISEAYSLL